MQLLTLHKVLISAALAFFLFFGIREITHQGGSVAMGIGALILSVGVGAYLIWVLRGGYKRN